MSTSAIKYREEGLRLQQARKSLGLTQKTLAEGINSSLAAVKAYERGMSLPNRQYAAALANLGINMGYVFSNEQPILIPIASRAAHGALVDRVMAQAGDGADSKSRGERAGTSEAKRLRSSTQSLMKICSSLAYEPPMVWTALVQELMIIYGLSEAGAQRIMETLKAERKAA